MCDSVRLLYLLTYYSTCNCKILDPKKRETKNTARARTEATDRQTTARSLLFSRGCPRPRPRASSRSTAIFTELASPRRRPHGAAAAPHAPLTQAEGAADCGAGRTKTRCFALASMSSAFELTQSSRTGGSETGPVSTWLGLGLGLG